MSEVTNSAQPLPAGPAEGKLKLLPPQLLGRHSRRVRKKKRKEKKNTL